MSSLVVQNDLSSHHLLTGSFLELTFKQIHLVTTFYEQIYKCGYSETALTRLVLVLSENILN